MLNEYCESLDYLMAKERRTRNQDRDMKVLSWRIHVYENRVFSPYPKN